MDCETQCTGVLGMFDPMCHDEFFVYGDCALEQPAADWECSDFPEYVGDDCMDEFAAFAACGE